MGVNLEGEGTPGEVTENNAIIQTEPSAPSTLVECILAESDDTKLSLTWKALPTLSLKGGIEATSIQIYWSDKILDFELLYTDVPPFKYSYLYNKTYPSDHVTS